METWIDAIGTFLVDKENKRVAVELGRDFAEYYKWIFENYYKESFDCPRYGGHITLCTEEIHKTIDYLKAEQFCGQKINFQYNINVNLGGRSKNFTTFWFAVKSVEIEKIKQELGILESEKYLGLHISVANNKNGFRKFQKQMVPIK